jgi:hypothetical protein
VAEKAKILSDWRYVVKASFVEGHTKKSAAPGGCAESTKGGGGGGDILSMPDGISSEIDSPKNFAASQYHIVNSLIICVYI